MLLWITYFKTETFSRNVIFSVGSSHTLCVLWKELRFAAPPYWTPNQIRVNRLQRQCLLFECPSRVFLSIAVWKVAQMNCHLRGYIFCFCFRLLHLVPNSRGFLWICSDQVSVFQEFGSSNEFFNSYCRVPCEIWNVEGLPRWVSSKRRLFRIVICVVLSRSSCVFESS